jgi:hypothetical protein
MICPDCKFNSDENTDFCPNCAAATSHVGSAIIPAPPSQLDAAPNESFPLKAWKYSVAGAVSLVEDVAKVAFVVVSTPVIFGFIGLIIGSFFAFLFYKYSNHAYHGAHAFEFAMVSVIYFGAGALLTGYLGFLFGISRAIKYVLIERKMFSVAMSSVIGAVADIVKKQGPVASDSAANIDPGKTTVTYGVLKKSLDSFKHGKVKDGLNDILAAAGKNKMNFMLRLVFRLIMRNEVAAMLVKRCRHIFRNRKVMTFAELSGSIATLGDAAGTKLITDFYSDKVMMFAILIPIHLALPFIIVFFASR